MTELPPPQPPPPLRLDRPLPAYRYVPGLHPHPFRHPAGHLYTDGGPPPEAPWSPDIPWHQDEGYLRGLDLFDHRYYWEAHEAWEAVWHHVPRETPYAALLQGLIQASAFVLKRHIATSQPSHADAAARLLSRATARLAQVEAAEGPHYRGVDLRATITALHTFAAGGDWPRISSGT